ncbi:MULTISPECIES: alpha/beta hydrolase [Streptosporangium]|uniref:Pimeloyl-ACP methyl ester carboxylesterase n=1 Tax=Streptosporangium brasiliense TaxID=47480 RepID=A0ABT9RL82_9ACTN|nr:alpha/beta hydrolase [Streptosporangium brasiliense]MDP9869571.1 pimeloyl-ACP methyl ester carboxylesterase [Streptosporangium brasiliense]
MKPTCVRALGRLVPALALIALSAAVAPPATADVGPPPPLDWKPCAQGPDDALGKELDRAGARCAELTVPLDHSRPGGRTIKLALSRLPATDRAHRIGTMVLNSGGPGESTLGMPLRTRTAMKDVAARYDLVGLDPRFVGRSTPLDCGWPIGLWLRSAGPTRTRFDHQVAVQRDLAERCARRHADVLPYANTRDTARDIDLVRRVLGERRISFLGYSYGSYLGAVYTQMFPGRTDRVVLDSAGDPDKWGPRATRGTEDEAERALRGWAAWAAERHGTYGLGATTARVLATVNAIVAAAQDRPLRVGAYEVDDQTVPYILSVGSGDDRPAARAQFTSTVRTLNEAAHGRPAAPGSELDGFLTSVLTSAGSPFAGPAAAIICGDRAAPRDPDTYWNDVQRSRTRHPLFGPLKNNIWPCAFWPNGPRERLTHVANPTPALIVSATGDTATTYEGSKAMHRALTGSRLLTLRDTTAHGIYGEYGNTCVDAKVNAYLATGTLPAADPICHP